MKIAYLAKNIDHGSGGGRYALNVIKNVKALGHDVIVLKEEDDGHEGLVVLDHGLKILINIPKLRRVLKSYDVVHALDIWPYGVHAFLAVVGTNKKLFISGVGTYSVLPLESIFKKFVLTFVINRATEVFCISKYVKDEIIKRVFIKNASVVHLGFSPLPKLSPQEKEYYRKRYSLESVQGPILLTVGAIKHRKGQLDTLKAIAKLRNKYPGMRYIMVGTMYEEPYIALIKKFARENGLEKNIMLVGDAKDDKALSFFYDACDLFIMNSNNHHGHFEGFGLVFLEAAGFGKSVVGSRDCGIEDALEDGFNGYLSKQSDHDDIAQKIEGALENKERFGNNSKVFVKRFSWEKTILEYTKSYNNLKA